MQSTRDLARNPRRGLYPAWPKEQKVQVGEKCSPRAPPPKGAQYSARANAGREHPPREITPRENTHLGRTHTSGGVRAHHSSIIVSGNGTTRSTEPSPTEYYRCSAQP